MYISPIARRFTLLCLGLALVAGCDDKDAGAETDAPIGDDDDDDDTVGACGEFQLVGDALPSALLSIWGTSASDVYMVGPDDGTGPLVYHFDGTTWERLDTGTTGDLWWAWGDGDTLWMGGASARIVKYEIDTGTFTEETIGDPMFTIFGVWGSGPDDVYAVGSDIAGNRSGVIFHWDGVAWSTAQDIADSGNGSMRQPFKIWGNGPDDIWVVGTNALITHWDGTAWTDFVAPVSATTTLFTVHGTGADNVYAVGGFGNAAVAHWDGAAWTLDSPPPAAIAPAFTGVYVDETLGPVAAGNNGAIWTKTSESPESWAPDCRTPATTWNFHASWVDPEGGIWAVGGDLINLDYGVIIYGGDGSIPSVDGT